MGASSGWVGVFGEICVFLGVGGGGACGWVGVLLCTPFTHARTHAHTHTRTHTHTHTYIYIYNMTCLVVGHDGELPQRLHQFGEDGLEEQGLEAAGVEHLRR